MAVHISEADCEALARLAQLSLEPGEAAAFGAQLADIIRFIETLQEVDIRDVPEYLSAETPTSALREDIRAAPLERSLALAAAPATRDGAVVVPKFKED
jgi:aspartyl/glutamyl-tRNA(Asn/Gln) amidotransferase C subunit